MILNILNIEIWNVMLGVKEGHGQRKEEMHKCLNSSFL
jgi:hypothetical protein